MRASFLVPLTVVLGAASVAAAQDLNDARRVEIARRLRESTVSIDAGESSGSGFVLGPERWIVTNAHVIQGGRGGVMTVRFSDGAQCAARELAFDPSHDLAVLECEGAVAARPMELADSDPVQVGQTVLAIGSPFGLDGTLTQGIVSARRDVPGIAGAVRGLIQTDATINPGNSGGPLANARGDVIGVNTAILSRSGGSQGIGFAVPSNYVRDLLARIRRELREPRPTQAPAAPATPPQPTANAQPVWLGLYGDDFHYGAYTGVRVRQVVEGGPAALAGLLGSEDAPPPYVRQLGVPWTGHIILAVDGQRVRSLGELSALVGRRAPGDRAVLTVTVGPGVLTGDATVELGAPPEPSLPPGRRGR